MTTRRSNRLSKRKAADITSSSSDTKTPSKKQKVATTTTTTTKITITPINFNSYTLIEQTNDSFIENTVTTEKQQVDWNTLPNELWVLIFSFLPPLFFKSKYCASLVSNKWRQLIIKSILLEKRFALGINWTEFDTVEHNIDIQTFITTNLATLFTQKALTEVNFQIKNFSEFTLSYCLKQTTKTNIFYRKVGKVVRNETARKYYRPDLADLALLRARKVCKANGRARAHRVTEAV